MGSAGTGKFGNYRVGIGNVSAGESDAVGQVGIETGEIDCPSFLENIRLEDVATTEFFIEKQLLPKAGDLVVMNNSIYRGRLVVSVDSEGEVLGNIPTKYNYLINCIKKGIQYKGVVVASGLTPVPFVVVTLNA
ncbi:MAG: hypothetical protein RBT15_04225 [Gudongella sp.]|jgi:hypothetical protein|nr:hypothetical protein [Gudongella sp.]